MPTEYQVPSLDEKGYESLTKSHGSDFLVVNYWATWCSPCVEEIPYFVKVAAEQKAGHVQFVGLSLDFPNQVESKVVPFLKKEGVKYPNFLLDVYDQDAFIGQVSDEWNGEIPATFIYDRTGRLVAKTLRPVDEAELREFVSKATKASDGKSDETASDEVGAEGSEPKP
ncbi:MAG: TlpA disulfide reductase family protein [Candidatus Sumerlaeia bacterium]|nr:TlpA disulfide reductase family protein [Candidatus Sumerlaeia bacterium]